MARYRLRIAYDGTDFHGWQKQPAASADARPGDPSIVSPVESTDRPQLRTVQYVVESAVRDVIREPVELLGASRTDSGVHAEAQVAAFSCSDDRLGPADDRLALAINARLPEDVVVLACKPTRDDFDPIRECVSKAYRYMLHVGLHRPLWDRRYVHHVRWPLDESAMAEAAQRFVGEHDFAAFAAAGHGRLSTVRAVHACDVDRPRDDRIVIDVVGSGFLHNMVRIIAGTLVEVGRGKMTPEAVSEAIESNDRSLAGPTLPPTGLCLKWIKYAKDESLND